MLPIVIGMLFVAIVALFANLGTSYYTQVKVIRHFFKNKGTPPDEYLEKTSVIKDIDYSSVFPRGSLDIYTANDAILPQPVLLWVHGGGYVGGDKSCIKAWAHILAAELKIAVVSINYCLAPEQHYPVPLIQLGESLRFLKDNAEHYNLDTSKIFLGGDSAGAQITSQFAAIVCNRTLRSQVKIYPPITPEELRGILLCCGFYNMDTVLKTHFPAIKTFMWAYTNAKKPSKHARKDELSTVKHVSDGYCDVYITCGNNDPFITQAHEFAYALNKSEICTDAYFPCEKGRKLGHEYQFSIGTPEADTALDKAVKFIEKRL